MSNVKKRWNPNLVVEARFDNDFITIVSHLTNTGFLGERIVAAEGGWSGEFDMPYEYPVRLPHTNKFTLTQRIK